MMTFTKEQNGTLQAQAKDILSKVAEGENTRDIIARIYVENLDEKTMKQGQIMADAILGSVKKFDADYKDAQEDLDRFIKKFQDEVDEGKSCVERCNYWLKMSAAISAATVAMSDEGADRDQILHEIESMEVSEEEATPEREKELRLQAMEAIKNSGVMLGALAEQAKALEEMSTADEAAGMLIDLGNKEIEYRAIVAMLAYTKIKNGEFENIPVEMTAAQVATVVCAEIEQTKIMEAVGKGNIAVDVASALLSILGVIVLVKVGIALVAVGAHFATTCFGAILAIPACLMVVVGVCTLICKGMAVWIETSKNFVKKAAVVIKTVIKGIKMVASYISEKVIPAIVEKAKNIYSSVKSRFVKESANTVVELSPNSRSCPLLNFGF